MIGVSGDTATVGHVSLEELLLPSWALGGDATREFFRWFAPVLNLSVKEALSGFPIRSSAKIPLPEHDFRVLWTKTGDLYISIPVKRSPAANVVQGGEHQAPQVQQKRGAVAIDPGCRAMNTVYDEHGLCVEFGRCGIAKSIFKHLYSIDQMISYKARRLKPPEPGDLSPTVWRQRVKKVKRARRSYQRAIDRKFLKVKRMIRDIHQKVADWLCKTYSVILLPKFETSRMVRRRKDGKRVARKITKKTVRTMLTWSHYKFRQLLLHRAKRESDCTVIICDEAYTSKTCGACGKINDKLGGSKVFKCPQLGCDHVADRDFDAARKILIRYLVLNCIPPPGVHDGSSPSRLTCPTVAASPEPPVTATENESSLRG